MDTTPGSPYDQTMATPMPENPTHNDNNDSRQGLEVTIAWRPHEKRNYWTGGWGLKNREKTERRDSNHRATTGTVDARVIGDQKHGHADVTGRKREGAIATTGGGLGHAPGSSTTKTMATPMSLEENREAR